jgi:ribosome assembly protein YihI (activator of Der GTPase)
MDGTEAVRMDNDSEDEAEGLAFRKFLEAQRVSDECCDRIDRVTEAIGIKSCYDGEIQLSTFRSVC